MDSKREINLDETYATPAKEFNQATLEEYQKN